jgi:tetratricopeptide (TPR) repeat protein
MNEDPSRDLEIRILRSDRRGGSCPVVVVGRDDRRAQGRFRSPFTAAQVQDAIVALDLGRFEVGPALSFGSTLFRALIRDDVKTVYDASSGDAEPVGLRLIVDDAKAARIPWELLVDPTTGTPFATRHRLVRGFSTSTGARPLTVPPPLRVLLADSSPTGVPRLEAQLEVSDIRTAIEAMTSNGRIVVEILPNASEVSLLNALRERSAGSVTRKPVHVFHWIGHGGIDPTTGNAALLFEDEHGRPDTVDGQRLSTILSGSDVRLVFLNACYSAAPSAEVARAESSIEVTAGVAEALLVSGIPGVIGMQATVGDDRARRFARDFYASLADGARIDEAVLDARKLVRDGADGIAADIGIPVCYLRADSSRLLEAPQVIPRVGFLDRFGALGRGARWAIGTAGAAIFGAAVLGVLAVIAGFLQGPPRMQGEFNVVVTEFVASDGAGQGGNDTARALSVNLFDALRTELAGLKDLHVEVMAPSAAGRLSGATPDERGRQAQHLASATNGDMVIYGSLDAAGTSLQPEFYISPKFLAGAEELVGTFRLGTPITSLAPPGNPAVSIDLRRKLQSRTSAMTVFVAGLTLFAGNDFSRAQGEFERAIDDGGWDDRDGKEVVFLFRGTAAALQGNLTDARTAYETALGLNPEYGRAMIGLAQVELNGATGGCDPATANDEGLAAARDEFRAALDARDQPPLSNVPAKAHFGIARVDVCRSQAFGEGSWADADQEIQAVISAFEADGALQDLAAEAHALRAQIRLPAPTEPDPAPRYLAAADEYRAAIGLSMHDGRKASFNDSLGWVLERIGQRTEAAHAYDEAIRLAPDDAAGNVYRGHRQRLDATPSPLVSVAT